MAGEIFVGSVAVSVVPDLRGFNTKLRSELVPAAKDIGQQMGREISRGISGNLDFGKIVASAYAKSGTAMRDVARTMGISYGRAFKEGFNREVKDLDIKVNIDDRSIALMRKKISLALKDAFTIKVKADIDQASFAKLAIVQRIAASAGGAGGAGVAGGGGGGAGQDINTLLRDLFGGRGGGGRGAVGAAGGGGGGGFFNQASALFRAAPGGAPGNVGALSPTTIAVGAGIGALAAPFIAQVLGGGLVTLLGGGLAGMGIYGALSGNVGKNAAAAQAAQTKLPGAQASLTAAQDRVVAAQARLNQLQASGRATTAQLAAANASLASAQAGVVSAQQRYNTLQQTASDANYPAQVLKMQTAWTNLKSTAQDSITQIGKSFVPVMTFIFNTANSVMKKMAPIFAGAVGTIAGPFQKFADTFISSFGSPNVQKSIQAVATAFGDILNAFTPDIPGIFNSMADAISRIANAVAKNPKAFADFLNLLAQLVIGILNTIAYLTEFANYIEMHFIPVIHDIVNALKHTGIDWAAGWRFIVNTVKIALDVIKNLVSVFVDIFEGHWRKAGRDVVNIVQDFGKQVENIFRNLMPIILSIVKKGLDDIIKLFNLMAAGIIFILDHLRHSVAALWDLIWNNTIGRAERGASDLMHIFNVLESDIHGFFVHAGNWLVDAGANIIHGLYTGIKNAMSGINSWVKSIVVDPLVGAVKSFFGIHSPSTVMAGVGRDITKGLLHGILTEAKPGQLAHLVKVIFGGWPEALANAVDKTLINVARLPKKALDALGSVAGKVGGFFSGLWHKVAGGTGGVQQWSGTVLQALSMLHLPMGLMGQVLYQMQTESGGNPNAINLWDINAQHGDPSRGLMQVIGGTFSAYHVPGTSSNIYDPLANIAAAINYALHTYGPTLMRGGMGMGSGHGYAAGTAGAAPGWAWVGELGPELVHFGGGEQVIAVTRGYAAGTSVGTLEAEIRVLNDRIAILNRQYATYAAGPPGQLGRNLTAAQINVDRLRIADLQARIYALEHPGSTAASAHLRSATAQQRAAAAALRAQERAATRMGNAGATIAADLAKITTKTTAATFASDQALMLKDLRYYFTPSVAQQRSRLVIAQISSMQKLQAQILKLNTTMADAQKFQTQVLTNLQQNTGLGAIGIQGQGRAQGRSLLAGLNLQVGVLRAFGASIANLSRAGASQALLQQVGMMAPSTGTAYANTMATVLRKLHGLHAPASIINQLVALGPDAALAYANALAASDKRTLASIFSAEAGLGTAQTAVSRGIASAAYGGGYNTGKNFLAGLKSQQTELNKVFAQAGRALAQEAIRWFRVPYKQRPYGYQHGGWITEPVSGYGAYSGQYYTFAEAGREYVVPHGALSPRGGDGGTEYHAHFDGLTGAAIESHVRTAFQAMSLTQGALARQGRRS